MAALELLTFQATAPSTGAAMTAVTGNSATIRDTNKEVYLLGVWQTRQTAGFTRITSPLLHDAVVGMGGTGSAGTTILFEGWYQQLRAQDTLTVTGSGSATAGDIESSSILVWYEDLPGTSQRLISYEELMRRGEGVYTFANTLATGTTGGYSGSELITAEQDQLKANRDYAWIGTTAQAGAHAIRLTGSDFGNLGVGLPAGGATAAANRMSSCSVFWADLARRLEWPLIPVINASNKSNTFIDACTDENGSDPILETHFVLLAPSSPRAPRTRGRK